MTINSSKSFDDNIEEMKKTNRNVYDYQKVGSRINMNDYEIEKEKRKKQLNRSLTKEEDDQLRAEMLQKQQQIPYSENDVSLPSHEWVHYYIPQVEDEYDPRYEERKRNEYIKYYIPSELSNQETGEEQRKFGGKIYRRGGSIRRFAVGGDNPLENLMNSNNQFESTYNPYNVNVWASGQPQQSVAASSGNPFQNQLNTQNQAAVTANSGQGINTTTPQQSPAVAATTPVQSSTPAQPAATPATAGTFNPSNNPFVTGSANSGQNAMIATNTNQPVNNTTSTPAQPSVFNGQPFGMMAPGPTPKAANPLTNESLTSYLQSNAPENIASRQNTEDYNYQQAMQKDFGKSMDEVDMAYKDVAAAHPNYTNQEILKTLRTNYQDELNKKNADLKNQSMKAEQARLKSIAGTMKGASQAFDAGLAGLDLISRMNPRSSNMAVLKQNRENANPMNTMNIVGNRKGIEYAAHGGYTGLKEGVELNLTTQQIHELEKQGYKFQIL
jgi:hypothetical protein